MAFDEEDGYIHEKKELCGGDGFFGKKKIGGKFGLKMAKNCLKSSKMA